MKYTFFKNKANIKKMNSPQSGFTLIELMVATTIFIIVMVVAVGSILSIVDANRKSQALNSVINNLNFAVESMTRDIRTGKDYSVSTTVVRNDTITFSNSAGQTVVYSIANQAGSESDFVIRKTPPGGVAQDFTSPEVKITSLGFTLTGAGSGDGQPKVLILIKGYAGIKQKIRSYFTIQTLVSQRLLDNS